LIGIAGALDVSVAATAGAIVSGAYFGDKLSPLSDTTNLAAAMTGTNLLTHIRYMTLTTLPTLTVTLAAFLLMGLNSNPPSSVETQGFTTAISNTFNVSGWLFVVPILVFVLILK